TVGPDGRLWAGTVHRTRPGTAALWSLDTTGQLTRHWTGLTHGNGIAFSPTGDTMYVVDSGPGVLLCAHVDPVTGPDRPRVLARLDRADGIPDGLCVDADGDLWLAVWGAGCLLRLRPDGTPVGRVDLPERNVTSGAFVGPLLAVTTAADDVDPTGPGGSVHLLDVGRRGLPVHSYPLPEVTGA
ncbi:SMP-30/gluconolactonase/LRE family protein, partial [Micromonospora echinofusca]